MANCKSCNAVIMWVNTVATGKPMPLDPRKVDGGNVVIDPKTGLAHVVEPDGSPAHVSHFVTCPNAEKHRADAKQGKLF